MQVNDISHIKRGPFARWANTLWPLGNVIPLVPHSKQPLRGPDLKRWYRHRQKKRDVQRLVAKYGWADIALIMHDHLMAIDSDDPALYDFLKQQGWWPLPKTMTVESERGSKMLFRTRRTVPTRPIHGSDLRGYRGDHKDHLGDLKGASSYIGATHRPGQRRIVVPTDLSDIPYLPAHVEKSMRVFGSQSTPKRGGGGGGGLHALPTTVYGGLSKTSEKAVPVGVSARPSSAPFAVTPEAILERLRREPGTVNLLLSDQAVVGVVARFLGIGARIGRKFRCILPGHDERHPSAKLQAGHSGQIVYADWHQRSGPKNSFLTLAEVYASVVNGRIVRMRGASHLAWAVRLLIDAEVLRGESPSAPALRFTTDLDAHKVWDGFLRLVQVKALLFGPDATTTFTWKFAATWCGVTRLQARKAMAKLLAWKMVVMVGKELVNGKSTMIFAPGPGLTSREHMRQRLAWNRDHKTPV